jgi:hypothetical protein
LGVLNTEENLLDAKKNRFFYCLSMFIEKLPTEYVDSVIDFLFGFDDVTDGCYKLYNFSELKEPVYMWDKADRIQKENCIRAFLQDILPGHKEVLIHIYW